MMNKYISFDLDGTLMQNPFPEYVFPEIQEIVQTAASEEMNVVHELVQEHERLMSEGNVKDAYDWDAILHKFLNEKGLNVSIDIRDLVVKHSTVPKIHLLEERMVEELELLKSIGFKLAVATNGFYEYQAPVLKELGLYPLFDLMMTPDRIGSAKPNQGMLEEINRHGEVVAHVGDRIDHDIIMPNLFGTNSIWINRKMDQALRSLSPEERVFRSKKDVEISLKKEWMVDEIKFKNTYLPNYVVHSISEISKLMKVFA